MSQFVDCRTTGLPMAEHVVHGLETRLVSKGIKANDYVYWVCCYSIDDLHEEIDLTSIHEM